ncbi:hypothetical protein D9M70_373290 [compost metagenome]
MRNSQWQAHYLGRFTRQLSFEVQPGASDSIRFPHSGPYDARLPGLRRGEPEVMLIECQRDSGN